MNDREKRTNCGTCRYHRKEADGSWICTNPDSDYYTDWTEYGDSCEEYEERAQRR